MARNPHKLYRHDHLMARIVLPFVPHFVQPNHVTILRFLLIPFVAWYLWKGNYVVGIPLFVGTAFTDAIDGSLARVRKHVTRWGTFYDPVADKILIGASVLIMVGKFVNVWFAVLIVSIELLIALGGFLYRHKGKMQSASAWGKAKMFTQVTGITVLLFGVATGTAILIPVAVAILILAILLALISLYTYSL